MSKLILSRAPVGQYGCGPRTPPGTKSAVRRPPGVMLLVLLYLVAAAWFLRALLLLLFFAPEALPGSENWWRERDDPPGAAEFPIVLAISVALIAGTGLWLLKSWGRRLSLVLYGLIIAVALPGSTGFALGPNLSVTRSASVSGLITVAVAAAAFYYLCRPDVRTAFKDDAGASRRAQLAGPSS